MPHWFPHLAVYKYFAWFGRNFAHIERSMIMIAAVAALFPLYQWLAEAQDRKDDRNIRAAQLASWCTDQAKNVRGYQKMHRRRYDPKVSKSIERDIRLLKELPQIKEMVRCSKLGYATPATKALLHELELVRMKTTDYDSATISALFETSAEITLERERIRQQELARLEFLDEYKAKEAAKLKGIAKRKAAEARRAARKAEKELQTP